MHGLYNCICLCVVLCLIQKNFKLPRGLTKLYKYDYVISNVILDDFPCCIQWTAKNFEYVYNTHLLWIWFNYIFISVTSAFWIEASSGRTTWSLPPLLCSSSNLCKLFWCFYVLYFMCTQVCSVVSFSLSVFLKHFHLFSLREWIFFLWNV